MPALSFIAAQAESVVGHLPEARQSALAQALAGLCETRWHELRGPEPASMLDHALWSVTPPLADLFVDMYAAGDPRLDDVLQGHKPVLGLALLVLEQIARGDAEGARLAYEAMMVFESDAAAASYATTIATALRGRLAWPPSHRHIPQPPLWKALALVAAHTGRCDLKAIIEVIRLLVGGAPSAGQPVDESLERLRNVLLYEHGMHFIGIDEREIFFEQHGHAHKPATIKHVEDALIEIRQAWLAGPPVSVH